MTRVVLASGNAGKLRELAALLAPLDLALVPQGELGVSAVAETGTTFLANALLKARHAAAATGLPALADDSGLEVDALAGRPGVYSARYAGVQGDDAANNQKLLAELAPFSDEKRSAYYVCTAALADPTGEVKAVVEGRCHGTIIKDYRGTGGFGYDPLFLIPEYQRTFGELSARVKHALSHRARALEQLRPALRAIL